MKGFNGIESLAETIRQLSKNAENSAQNLDKIKGVFKQTESEVLNRLKTEEDKKKYRELIQVSNELLDSAPNKSVEDIHKSIENLRNYGKQYSDNS